MAKKRKTKNTKTHKTRVNSIHAKDPLRSFLGLDVPQYRHIEFRPGHFSPYQKPVQEPQWVRNAPAPSKRSAPTPAKQDPLYTPSQVVNRPEQTICSRRQTRKEVIHAFNHAGKAGQKKPVRNETSNIHCKG